jgi:superfamily II DNA/RNA helicase
MVNATAHPAVALVEEPIEVPVGSGAFAAGVPDRVVEATLAFAVPIVERLSPRGRPSALVLVPTRELAAEVAGEFHGIAEAKGLRVAAVFGGASIAKQVKAAVGADILVATPGRLLDLLRRKLLRLNRVGICVLHEADRMLDMGFLPHVSVILSILPESRQTMLFSATPDGEIGRLAARFTKDPVRQGRTVQRMANRRCRCA